MKFFFLLATGDEQAERVYTRIADRLKEMGYELTEHHISKVIYKREGKVVSEAVGFAFVCPVDKVVAAAACRNVRRFMVIQNFDYPK